MGYGKFLGEVVQQILWWKWWSSWQRWLLINPKAVLIRYDWILLSIVMTIMHILSLWLSEAAVLISGDLLIWLFRFTFWTRFIYYYATFRDEMRQEARRSFKIFWWNFPKKHLIGYGFFMFLRWIHCQTGLRDSRPCFIPGTKYSPIPVSLARPEIYISRSHSHLWDHYIKNPVLGLICRTNGKFWWPYWVPGLSVIIHGVMKQ